MNRPTIKRGARGDAVRTLQTMLKALGYYQSNAVDGAFGPGTEAAVEEFQEDVSRLEIDGVVGPNTWGALDGALVSTPEEPVADTDPDESLICDDETWAAWVALVKLVTTPPVKYGPGRGAFADDKWLVRDKAGNYPRGGKIGYHAFVCSTWTNFVCGYLLRYNEMFTPAGGMPSWSKVCESNSDPHPVPGLESLKFRGYGEYLTRIAPNVKDVPLGTLYEMREQLPTFIVASQASRKRTWWSYHHCTAFAIDHRQDGSPMYRIAADGYRGRGGFSKTPMVYKTVDAAYITKHDSKARLRPYAMTGLGKVSARALYPVELE